MRILFFGTSAFGIPSLERLVAAGEHVLVCVTQPDRPQGRGLAQHPSPIKTAARQLGVPVEEPEDLHAALPRFRELNADVGVVIAYGRLIPPALLQVPPQGMLGVHPSWLPKYRGASPMVGALLNAEPTTGVTVFRLDARLDAGDMAKRRAVPIAPRETAETLSARLSVFGAALLLETLTELAAGTTTWTPQDERQATHAPKLTKADGRIDWRTDAVAIDRRVRALNPWPGTSTQWRGAPLKICSASFQDAPGLRGRPGEILSASADGLLVATGKGQLKIDELQAAGKRRMSVRKFLAGHPMKIGECLGGEP